MLSIATNGAESGQFATAIAVHSAHHSMLETLEHLLAASASLLDMYR